jgi:uncharacterized protein (DUF1499 family)
MYSQQTAKFPVIVHRHLLDLLGPAGLALALAGGVLAILSGFGTRWGWWHFIIGFNVLVAAAAIGGVAAIVSLIGGLAGIREQKNAAAVAAAFGIVIGLMTAGIPASWMYAALRMPQIHDISTDMTNPPQFVALMLLRAGASNSADYGGQAVAAQQKAAYPDIVPAVLAVPPADAFNRALEAAQRMGWRIVASDPAQGRIEATATTFWFGFTDDVVVRVTSAQAGSRVDIRSVSREGSSDVGTNAKRIRNFLLAMNAEKPAQRPAEKGNESAPY